MVTFPKVLKRLPRSTWSTITLDLSQRRQSSIIILICLNMTIGIILGDALFERFLTLKTMKKGHVKMMFFHDSDLSFME